MKICPQCNKEYPDEGKFCPEDGTPLVEKPAEPSSASAMSGGKILAGGDVTQNVSHHSETKVYHSDETKQMKTCVVSGRNAVVTEGATCRSCDGWALLEHVEDGICKKCSKSQSGQQEDEYRTAVREALTGDKIIDAEERSQLDALAQKLGISGERAGFIEDEVRSAEAQEDDSLSPRDKLLFSQAQAALYRNADAGAALAKLEDLSQGYRNNAEIARAFVLAATEANPERGLEFLRVAPPFRHDSAHKSVRKIELHESLGQEREAANEERTALRAFGNDSLIKAKALERFIDLYLEGEQEESQLQAVKEEAANWTRPQADDDPYLHFVDAYLDFATQESQALEPKTEEVVALYFCQRKLRLIPEIGKASAENDPEEQFQQGYRLATGDGVPQDHEEAAKWFLKAAEQGHDWAQYNLGYACESGNGVPQDHGEAMKWYKKAAEQGNGSAQVNLGVLYEIGDGVQQNHEEAVKWYRMAAEQGEDAGQHRLGILYQNGRGVPQNHEEAIKWYREAAEQGMADSQVNLGVLYQHSESVPQNHEEAVKWYRKAAEQGESFGQQALGVCYANGEGVPQNHEEAIQWFIKAAEQGNVNAMAWLGDCYTNGQGVPQNNEEALKWYRKGAEQGHEGCQGVVNQMEGSDQSPEVAQQAPAPPSTATQDFDTDQFCAEFKAMAAEQVGKVEGFFIGDAIPGKKLTNARTKCQVPPNEKIIALIDCTIMGSAKNGLLFSASGNLYMHNVWGATQSGAQTVPWTTLTDCEITLNPQRKYEVFIGSSCINTSASSLSTEQAKAIIEIFRVLFGNLSR